MPKKIKSFTPAELRRGRKDLRELLAIRVAENKLKTDKKAVTSRLIALLGEGSIELPAEGIIAKIAHNKGGFVPAYEKGPYDYISTAKSAGAKAKAKAVIDVAKGKKAA